MKIGVMQPYFFPYLGYWQLMNAVDEYFLMDDVNYIKRGYVSRNNILVNGEPFIFGIPVKKASQNRLICEHEQGLDEKQVNKLLTTLHNAYAKAPYFEETYELVKEVLKFGLKSEGLNLADFLANANILTARKIGIDTPIYRTSKDVHLDGEYKRENLIVAICKDRQATEYYNAIGGTEIYDQAFFNENGLELRFVKADDDLSYKQFGDDFIPSLSIIDVMMFCSKDQIKDLLSKYTLVKG